MPRELFFRGDRRVEIRSVPGRSPGPREALVTAVWSGISGGTELRHFRGPAVDGGVRPGYELVGRVAEAPTDPDLVGAMVWLDHPHADCAVVPAADARRGRLPDASGIPVERFAFLARTRTALNAVHDAGIRVGDRVAVVGLGVLGLLTVRLAVLSGAGDVVAIDPLADRRALAERWGARACAPGGAEPAVADVVIEASGRPASLGDATELCADRGGIVVLSTYPERSTLGVPAAAWARRQLSVRFTTTRPGASLRGAPRWSHQRLLDVALELLASGRVAAEELATLVMAFESSADAFARLDSGAPDCVSVLLAYATAPAS